LSDDPVFEIAAPGGLNLCAAREGEGPPIVLAHGITAHRDLVVHGSRALSRAGHEVTRYDARAHGDSDPAPDGIYDYEVLADDLAAVIADGPGESRPVLAGHSMGAHTIVNLALRDPDRIAGLVIIGPASTGIPQSEESLRHWNELADGLERDGIDGFLEVYEEQGLDPDWRDTLIRIARERLGHHRHLDALADAMRAVPRSLPFEGMTELEGLDVPSLVVASHDEPDPGHPYAVAEAYAEAIPDARLISEDEGKSPLAWQGGLLSREIASFCDEDRVRERVES
jgi:pimeloyl-ACP methyl ester carboxylesterase